MTEYIPVLQASFAELVVKVDAGNILFELCLEFGIHVVDITNVKFYITLKMHLKHALHNFY